MIRRRKFLACAMSSALALCSTAMASTAMAANTTCPLGGEWHFFALEANSPAIQTIFPSVDTPSGTETIETFSNQAFPYNNNTASAINCTLTVLAGGSFSNAPCNAYVMGSGLQTTMVSGQISQMQCNLTGTINIPDATSVSIVSGYVNGNSAAGIATQGSNSVMYFTLVKNAQSVP